VRDSFSHLLIVAKAYPLFQVTSETNGRLALRVTVKYAELITNNIVTQRTKL
jgi:hypothetical protein